jgi:hypothetical protein
MTRERLAYVCLHKDHEKTAYRVFLLPGEPVPKCHGKTMSRQANLVYSRPDTTGPVGKSQTTRKGRQ